MFKRTLLAIALASASTGAFAAADGSTGNGNLYLAASGLNAAGAQVTLAYNTGIFLEDFLPAHSVPTAAFGTVGTFAADTATTQNRTFNLGVAWNSFIGQVANPTSIQWAVYASDTNPSATNTLHRFLGTSNILAADLQVAGQPTQSLSNTEFGQMGAALNGFVTGNNGLQITDPNVVANTFGAGTAAGGYAVSIASPTTQFANYDFRNMMRFGLPASAQVGWDPDAGLGESRNFLMVRRNLTSSSAAQLAQVDDFANQFGAATWSLSSTGVLSYTAPIPEPGEWALMLAGMGIIGAIARRRKSAI
jgi:hypothetical protein